MKTIVDLENDLVKPYIDAQDKKYAANIAPVETSPATGAHSVGSQIIYNGVLYDVTAAIAATDALVVGTNIAAADDVVTELSSLKNALSGEVVTRSTLGAHNLLDSIIDSDTQHGLTATKQSDGSFIISGELESGHSYVVFILNSTINVKEGITYSVSGGISNYVYLEAWSGTDFDVKDNGSGVTFTPSADEVVSFGIVVISGVTLPQRVYPMIRLTSDSDTTYRPYVPTNSQLLSYKDNGVLGAKNLFKNKLTSQVIHGITVTVNDDGSFEINGTNDGTASWGWLGKTEKFKLDIPSGDYLISGAPSGATTLNYCLKFYDEGDGTSTVASYMIQNGNEVLVHIDNTHYFGFYLWVGANQTVSNVTFKPMIRLAIDTDPTYQPYAMTNRELTNNLIKYEDYDFSVEFESGDPNSYVSVKDIDVRENGYTPIAISIDALSNASSINIMSLQILINNSTARMAYARGSGGYSRSLTDKIWVRVVYIKN